MTGSLSASLRRREGWCDEKATRGREDMGTFESRETYEKRRLYDSALLRGWHRGRWCRSGCIGQKNKEMLDRRLRAERETERVVEKRWQKEETKGDRVWAAISPSNGARKQNKGEGEASSSNTIKPTLARRKEEEVGKKGWEKEEIKTAKEEGREQWRASYRESCCRCCLPLSDVVVFALLPLSCPSSVVPLRFSCFFFFFLISFFCFSPLTTPRDNCFRVARKGLALEN